MNQILNCLKVTFTELKKALDIYWTPLENKKLDVKKIMKSLDDVPL